MRVLDPEVANPVWAAVEVLLPSREDNHPLGCHNPRISDRIWFWGYWSGWRPAVGGRQPNSSWPGRCRTRHCGPDATSG